MLNQTPTFRLHNLSMTNLSINLAYGSPNTGTMRRGLPTVTSIVVPLGGYFDVCFKLQITYDEAKRVLERSPELKTFERKGLVKVLDWPKDVESATPVGPTPTMPDGVTPATDQPELKPAPIVPPPEAPVFDMASVELDADPTEHIPTGDGGGGAAAVAAETSTLDAPNAGAGTAPVVATEVPMHREPSAEWSEADLRAFAERNNIDISKARGKAAVLRAIRGVR